MNRRRIFLSLAALPFLPGAAAARAAIVADEQNRLLARMVANLERMRVALEEFSADDFAPRIDVIGRPS